MIGHRTLKRVPLDFDWPLGVVWHGYLRPDVATNKWRPKEPPRGKGYQLWEITSEGSPMSPVFSTAEQLAEWCEAKLPIFGDQKLSAKVWLNLFRGKGKLENASLGVITPDGDVTSAANAPKSKPRRRKRS